MIRKFSDRDIDEVMEIWLCSNMEAHAFIPADDWKSHFDDVREQIVQAEVYVSERNGVVNGFIGMTWDEIAGIFVKKAERQQGIGTELLNTAKLYRRELRLSAYKKNQPAVRFYENAGFRIAACETDTDTGEEAYTMVWIHPE